MLQVSQIIKESQGLPLLVIDCEAHVGESGVGFKSTYELIGKQNWERTFCKLKHNHYNNNIFSNCKLSEIFDFFLIGQVHGF